MPVRQESTLGPAGRLIEPGRRRVDATRRACLLAACCFGWFAVQRLVRERKISAPLIRDMVLLVAPFVVLVAAHYLFRYAYYGEWLPNTYYAKHVRPWYESGFRYLYSRRAGDRAVSGCWRWRCWR